MENGLIKMEKTDALVLDQNTGLVIGNGFVADSGFAYAFGLREFGDLKIMEAIAQGTAVTFLNGVQVIDGNGNLIIDKKLGRGTHYSRETVRLVVLEELLSMLENAALKSGKEYDRRKAQKMISDKLDLAYYSKSYEAILNWAEQIGIDFK